MDNDLISILDRFSDLKVLVVGEAILDSYIRGKADRLSLEAPAPVIQAREGQDLTGGAANVAMHASRLGATVELLSVLGEDEAGSQLRTMLREEGVGVEHILCDSQRDTLLKRWVYADDRLLVRYDQGTDESIDEDMQAKLLERIETLCPQVDVVILSDYGMGIFTPELLQGLRDMQARTPCVMVADTRRLEAFQGLRLAAIRPSYYSALEMLNLRGNGHQEPVERLCEAGEKILDKVNTEIVAITLDDNGALVLERDNTIYRTYAPSMPFNRVRGAGDAFIAALALGLGAGGPAPAAAEVASATAAIVVSQGGLPACCMDELRARLFGNLKLFEDWTALGARLEALRQQGRRIVFTNGVFDILHSAHVAYLNQAKSFGDVLVIGVNTDESVRRLKGPTRPINNLEERCRVLAGLSCVDFVVPFGDKNPVPLIHVVRPSVYVKGGDYTRETLPEAEVVESYGGALQIVPYIANHSTTGVIERIRNLDAAR